MLYSQGVRLEELGIKPKTGEPIDFDPRAVWRRFAENYHLFRGTPTRMWLDHVFATLFGFTERLSADERRRLFRPHQPRRSRRRSFARARFSSASTSRSIATTDSPLDPLAAHEAIRDVRLERARRSRLSARSRSSIPISRAFRHNVEKLGDLTGCDTLTWSGYLEAHRKRRAFFK